MVAPFSKRNRFNYLPDHIFTCKMGELIPFINFPVVPGDTFNVGASNMTRFQALLSPAYAKINTFCHFFFVPYRIIWDNWEQFITKGEDGTASPNYPTITFSNGVEVGSLADHLGFPTNEPAIYDTDGETILKPARTVPMTVSALPFRAVAKIWNEWYRNENLQDEVGLSTADGSDITTNTSLLYRNWRPDYFTQNLPFRQRGPQVTVPLGTLAPVGTQSTEHSFLQTNSMQFKDVNNPTTSFTTRRNFVLTPSPSNPTRFNATYGSTAVTDTTAGQYMVPTNLYADLRNASSASIADWRLAFQVQRLLEKNARGGARYVEWLMSHFGVRCSDGRLQRPEYLGGGKSPVMISEVLQTSATETSGTPQGNMSGHAFSAQLSHSFTKSFDEYGIVIGFYSCMPKSMYYQGIEREWLKTTPYEFYLPVLSHLSEQGTYNAEVYATGVDSDDKAIFGYNPIYEEYRHMYSKVSGEFKTSLSYWQFGRRWSEAPALNSDFVKCVPTEDPFAVQGEDNLLVSTTTRIRATRPIPKRGTPGYIDHD